MIMVRTPSFTNWPLRSAPFCGTTRAKLVTKGGYMRRDSSITASRKVRPYWVRKVMSLSLVKALRISKTSWLITCAWVHKK
jgi:hypothetical protein